MFKAIRSFGREIYNNYFSLDDALEQQIILKDVIDIFKKSSTPKESFKKEKKLLKILIILIHGRQQFLNAFESGIFPKRKHGEGRTCIQDHTAHVAKIFVRMVSNQKKLKILAPKQMLQWLAIALAQVQACNIFENLLNEICQIIYYL